MKQDDFLYWAAQLSFAYVLLTHFFSDANYTPEIGIYVFLSVIYLKVEDKS